MWSDSLALGIWWTRVRETDLYAVLNFSKQRRLTFDLFIVWPVSRGTLTHSIGVTLKPTLSSESNDRKCKKSPANFTPINNLTCFIVYSITVSVINIKLRWRYMS